MKALFPLLIIIPLLSFSQEIEFEMEEEVEVSAFRASMFGGGYCYPYMNKLLSEDPESISKNITKMTTKVEDLHIPKNDSPYEYTKNIGYSFRYKYLLSQEIILKQLDSICDIYQLSEKWKNRIIASNKVNEIINYTVNHSQSHLETSKDTLFLKLGKATSGTTSLYLYVFNKKDQLTYDAYGRINHKRKDSVLWMRNYYTYKKKNLVIKSHVTYFDNGSHNQWKAYKLHRRESTDTLFDKNHRVSKVINTDFNKMNNLKYSEETKTYHRNSAGNMDSLVYCTYLQSYIEQNDSTLVQKGVITYQNNRELFEFTQNYGRLYYPRNFHHSTKSYKYDEKGLLASSTTQHFNEQKQVIELTTEQYIYEQNKFTFVYKRRRQNQQESYFGYLLPLEYKMSFSFE